MEPSAESEPALTRGHAQVKAPFTTLLHALLHWDARSNPHPSLCLSWLNSFHFYSVHLHSIQPDLLAWMRHGDVLVPLKHDVFIIAATSLLRSRLLSITRSPLLLCSDCKRSRPQSHIFCSVLDLKNQLIKAYLPSCWEWDESVCQLKAKARRQLV